MKTENTSRESTIDIAPDRCSRTACARSGKTLEVIGARSCRFRCAPRFVCRHRLAFDASDGGQSPALECHHDRPETHRNASTRRVQTWQPVEIRVEYFPMQSSTANRRLVSLLCGYLPHRLNPPSRFSRRP